MFADWKNDVAHVKKSFGALGKKYPKMLQAYGALGAAAAEGNVLDAKTRELIALAVAVTTRCESCIGVHADEAVKAGATEEEVAAALAMSIALKCRCSLHLFSSCIRSLQRTKRRIIRKELYDSFSPHFEGLFFLSLKLTAL